MHPQPARQPLARVWGIDPGDEQLVQAEARDHEGRAHQEQVGQEQEEAEVVAGQLRADHEAPHRPDEHLGPVGERGHRREQQDDHRDDDHQPGQAQRPFEAVCQL
jgi:hypothetical protein